MSGHRGAQQPPAFRNAAELEQAAKTLRVSADFALEAIAAGDLPGLAVTAGNARTAIEMLRSRSRRALL